MNNVRSIRRRLSMSQVEFALAIGVSQGNVSHMEARGQEVSPSVARRIISAAEIRGVRITFDDIYEPQEQGEFRPGTEASA